MANEPQNVAQSSQHSGQQSLALTTTDLSVAEIRRDVQDVTRDVASLIRIIRDGNGHQPLLTRVVLLEKKLDEVAITLTDVRKALETRAIEDTKGRWQIVSVMISGLIALVSAIVSGLILFKKP